MSREQYQKEIDELTTKCTELTATRSRADKDRRTVEKRIREVERLLLATYIVTGDKIPQPEHKPDPIERKKR